MNRINIGWYKVEPCGHEILQGGRLIEDVKRPCKVLPKQRKKLEASGLHISTGQENTHYLILSTDKYQRVLEPGTEILLAAPAAGFDMSRMKVKRGAAVRCEPTFVKKKIGKREAVRMLIEAARNIDEWDGGYPYNTDMLCQALEAYDNGYLMVPNPENAAQPPSV